MNWSNVNLRDNYERDQNFLDPYSFDTLLLEISCNIRDENLNQAEIRKMAIEHINNRIVEAIEILDDNLDNITKEAIRERFISNPD